MGVDLGHDDLKMVKISQTADQKYEILGYARIPFDSDFPRESAQFYKFLRSALGNFCDGSKNIDIWSIISSARVETRQLRIPKVAARQIPNSVYWTYQKDSPFDDREKIFDFELLGDVEDEGIPKTNVMSYTAPREEVKELQSLFSKAGFPLSGISIVPFAYQTLFRAQRLDSAESYVASLFIGRNWSRIDIFSDGNLMLSRGIKAGIRTMIEALRSEMEGEQRELSVQATSAESGGRIRVIKKKADFDLEQAQQFFFGGIHESSSAVADNQKPADEEDRIFELILPALRRLVKQVERTIRHFSSNHDNARVEKIYISSGVRPHRRVFNYISAELGLPAETINPFDAGPNFLTRTPGPEAPSEQSSYAPAMGMALADNSRTPNFLFTHKDKQKVARSQRINRTIFAGFVLLMALCVGISFWQEQIVREKDAQRVRLRHQLEDFDVRVDKNLIIKLVDEFRKKNQASKKISQKYLGLAVISEISKLTPSEIRLLSISAQLGPWPPKKSSPQGKTAPSKLLTLDGVIQGERVGLESSLAGYLMQLRDSPLFDQPAVRKKSFEFLDNKEVLRFTTQLNLK
ncbi:MAG: pilus assembly protein PilM [Desulfobacterales bacterium]|nr:MAG: pilus assembly protein PilM [Desulfobacterales bacterium]